MTQSQLAVYRLYMISIKQIAVYEILVYKYVCERIYMHSLNSVLLNVTLIGDIVLRDRSNLGFVDLKLFECTLLHQFLHYSSFHSIS